MTKEEDFETNPPGSARSENVQRLVLFRKEALRAAEQYPFADIPDQRTGNRILTLMLISMVVVGALVCVLIGLSPAEQIRGKFVLLPPAAVVRTPQDGTILSIGEPVGADIARGVALITIDISGSDAEQLKGERREALNKLRRDIDQLIAKRRAEVSMYADRLVSNLRTRDALVKEIETNEEQVKALRKTADLLSEKREMMEKLVNTNAMSKEDVRSVGIEYQRAESDYYEQKTALMGLRRTLGEKERDEPALIAERDAKIAEMDGLLLGLRAAEVRLSKAATMTVTAPIDGKLTYLDVRVGDAVSAGTSLAVVTPSRQEPFARVDVPSETIRRFGLGKLSPVSVTYNVAHGTNTIPATIVSLSSIPLSAGGTEYKLLVGIDNKNRLDITEGMDATLNIAKSYFSTFDAFLSKF